MSVKIKTRAQFDQELQEAILESPVIFTKTNEAKDCCSAIYRLFNETHNIFGISITDTGFGVILSNGVIEKFVLDDNASMSSSRKYEVDQVDTVIKAINSKDWAKMFNLFKKWKPIVGNSRINFDKKPTLFVLLDVDKMFKHDPELVTAVNEFTIYKTADWHEDMRNDNVPLMQPSIDIVSNELATSVILLSHYEVPPMELKDDVAILNFPVPSESERMARATDAFTQWAKKDSSIPTIPYFWLPKKSAGLTKEQCDRAMIKAKKRIAKTGKPFTEERFKYYFTKIVQSTIGKVTVANLIDQDMLAKAVLGGCDGAKKICNHYSKILTKPSSASYGVTLKDGLLLVGVPGAGKSATVKFIGKELSLPVIEFQVEKVHNPYLGMSESNLAAVFELAENMAPCILFFDELEKLFGGKTGQVHETTDRMKGQFLKFVNDTIASVIVIATVNKTDAIAPEMLRAGRFNKWLFFDLLTYEERLEVFKLHIELDRTPDTDENDIYPPDREGAKDRIIRVADNFDVVTFAKRTENFTGAEIEQVVIQAIGNAFDLDLPDVNNELIERAILNMTPIAIRQPEYIKEIQKFGYKNCELANNSAASKQRQDEELKILASEAVQQNNADRSRFN